MLMILAYYTLNYELGIDVVSLVRLAGVDVTHVDTTVLVGIAVRKLMRSDCNSHKCRILGHAASPGAMLPS
jgi:hypothetical protein